MSVEGSTPFAQTLRAAHLWLCDVKGLQARAPGLRHQVSVVVDHLTWHLCSSTNTCVHERGREGGANQGANEVVTQARVEVQQPFLGESQRTCMWLTYHHLAPLAVQYCTSSTGWQARLCTNATNAVAMPSARIHGRRCPCFCAYLLRLPLGHVDVHDLGLVQVHDG